MPLSKRGYRQERLRAGCRTVHEPTQIMQQYLRAGMFVVAAKFNGGHQCAIQRTELPACIKRRVQTKLVNKKNTFTLRRTHHGLEAITIVIFIIQLQLSAYLDGLLQQCPRHAGNANPVFVLAICSSVPWSYLDRLSMQQKPTASLDK